jgi:hypothetical protein
MSLLLAGIEPSSSSPKPSHYGLSRWRWQIFAANKKEMSSVLTFFRCKTKPGDSSVTLNEHDSCPMYSSLYPCSIDHFITLLQQQQVLLTCTLHQRLSNRGSSVGIATGYGMDDRGSFLGGGGWEFFSSMPCPDRFWGPYSILSNGFQGLFPWG